MSYFKVNFNCAETLMNKGIKEKPIEMSYLKGSDFNRFFTSLIWICKKVTDNNHYLFNLIDYTDAKAFPIKNRTL